MATLEITAAAVVAPVGSCARVASGEPAATTPARIRQPHRKAGQFVFIAVLLHWSKFFYLPGVPRACRTRPCLPRGNSRRPSQSFPLVRRTACRLRGGNTCAPEDWKPQRSFPAGTSRFHRAAKYSPGVQQCPEAVRPDSAPRLAAY